MKVTATQTTICRQLVAKTKLELFNRSNTNVKCQIQVKETILEVFKCEESVNMAHYFPYDVKLQSKKLGCLRILLVFYQHITWFINL